MKHIIIGTAGHVDHGKTALVKALTGIDTDRLEEEQRRGVTIELGFAYLDFENDDFHSPLNEHSKRNAEDGVPYNPNSPPSSLLSPLSSLLSPPAPLRVGIIDVPGHEKFIRNMLAGAGGIDLAILVIAADEGVMPQTREHLGILSQLGIKNGLIAITKLDKVDSEWLELVIEDIQELVKGTFLEFEQIIPVSAHTGEGLPELKQALYEIVMAAESKNIATPFRLPADRVFPAQGFGIIVTGTLIEGSISTGDTAEILPMSETVTIRGIQVHGKSVETAYAGQRTALNLAGAKRLDVKRGDVIAAKDSINVASMIDVKLSALPESPRKIKSGDELHLYHGARTLLAKVVLLGGKSELKSGESCYARLTLREPLPCKRGDRFIMRFYSPLETLGGGVILDSNPKKLRSYKMNSNDNLELREKGSPKQIANLSAFELSGAFKITDLCRRADLDKKSCQQAVDELIKEKNILKLQPDSYVSAKVVTAIGAKCVKLLESYHEKYPLRKGMDIAELRQKLFPEVDISEANALLNALKSLGTIAVSENTAALSNHGIKLTPSQEKLRLNLLKTFQDAAFEPPSPDEIILKLPKKEQAEASRIIESMVSSGDLVILSPQIFWHSDTFSQATTKLHKHFESNEEITLAQCRDLLSSSRKFALAFLEHLDRTKVTRKTGDTRKLMK